LTQLKSSGLKSSFNIFLIMYLITKPYKTNIQVLFYFSFQNIYVLL
jgi:hypothetical protein